MVNRKLVSGLLGVVAFLFPACGSAPPSGGHQDGTPSAGPPGAKGPLPGFNLYLDAFHVMKDDPTHMIEAHHYCRKIDADRTECVLFDGPGEDARMNGVEHIISEALFDQLPAAERKSWHPHNYEILSGQLMLPNLSLSKEKAAVTKMMNSYGKTWHFTDPSNHGVPEGAPRLAWSFNADNECPESLITARDARIHRSTSDTRNDRADLLLRAHPQEGVDALAAAFPDRRPIPGVAEKMPPP